MSPYSFSSLLKSDFSPTTKAYYLERLVLNSLDVIIHNNKIQIFKEPLLKTKSNRHLRLDAMISGSLLELDGPVLLEIKLSINTKIILEILDKIEDLQTPPTFKTLLFCVGSELSDELKIQLKKIILSRYNLNFQVVIWDIHDLETKLFSETISNNLQKSEFLAPTNLNTDKPISGDKQSDNILHLNSIYKNEKLTLFLGSGVSKDHNLPLWNELIGGLSSEVLNNLPELHHTVKYLLTDELTELLSNNPLISASYLEIGFQSESLRNVLTTNDNVSFNRAIHKLLYNRYDDLKNKDSQMFQIAKGIINSPQGKGINKAVTYNYDNLLECCLDETDNSFNYQTIYKDLSRDSNKFPIYHVHGFLPHNVSKYNEYNLDEQELIFTEDSYHKLQNDHYSWRNLTQINSFREETVLMIGLSLTDPNIRRLLRQTSQQIDKTHYILLQRYSGNTSVHLRPLQENIKNNFLELHHSILKENLKKLGVNVIWYDDHSELSTILKEIFS